MKGYFTLLIYSSLLSFNWLIAQPGDENGQPGGYRMGPDFKETSLFSDGAVYKISVDKAGIYKLDYNFIKEKLKVDPAGISPSEIGIFGNGGGRVPQWNAQSRIDDLEQSATYGFGLDDGQFNPGDYLLWYAEGADRWTFDPVERVYNME